MTAASNAKLRFAEAPLIYDQRKYQWLSYEAQAMGSLWVQFRERNSIRRCSYGSGGGRHGGGDISCFVCCVRYEQGLRRFWVKIVTRTLQVFSYFLVLASTVSRR